MTHKVLKYEIEMKKGNSWISLGNRQDRDAAIAEAARSAGGELRSAATRVIAHEYDTESRKFDTRMVYSSEDASIAGNDADIKPAAPPAHAGMKKKKGPSATGILITFILLAVGTYGAVLVIARLFDVGWSISRF
jgi:hypothetical protein